MRALKLNMGAVLLCLLAACVTPKTFEERLAVSYQDVTEARNTGQTLLTADKITVKDAENVQKQADVVREGLDVAQGLGETAGKPKLDATIDILRALQTYLTLKQKGVQ